MDTSIEAHNPIFPVSSFSRSALEGAGTLALTLAEFASQGTPRRPKGPPFRIIPINKFYLWNWVTPSWFVFSVMNWHSRHEIFPPSWINIWHHEINYFPVMKICFACHEIWFPPSWIRKLCHESVVSRNHQSHSALHQSCTCPSIRYDTRVFEQNTKTYMCLLLFILSRL